MSVASKRQRKLKWALGSLLLGVGLSGCSTTQFYWQAMKGQVSLIANQEQIEKVIARTDTTPALREKLQETLDLRQFAETELRLPVNGQYRKYVDVQRRFVVWNVHAAPAFSLEAKTWWYPLVGRLKYRGFFREDAAQKLAAEITAHGDDAYVGGVEAYSTLGWLKDPILSTFIHHESCDLAEILFHELAHQELFISGDTDFNEAFAVSVAQEGTRRWLRSRKSPEEVRRYNEDLRKELGKHLSVLERQGIITTWHDRMIGAGTEWDGVIDAHLNDARVILLLISADFIHSQYCYDVEMKRALDRHDKRQALVVPIILRAVSLKGTPFAKLQALPKDAKPVVTWADRDSAFVDVTDGLRNAIQDLVGTA